MTISFSFRTAFALFVAFVPLVTSAADSESMFDAESYRPLVSEAKARHVGDILTVVIQENASASSSADLSGQRKTSINGEVGSSKTGIYNATAGAGTESDGGGRTQRSGRLLATVSVRVLEVTNGGDLIVQGQQNLQINGEEQTITLSGIVRSRDIAENNTVVSGRIAEARVEFSGEGFVSDKSKPGWISQLFTSLGF